MKLKTIEKYRSAYDMPAGYPWVRQMIEEIEAEVGERYVERREGGEREMTLKSLEHLRDNGWRHMDDVSYAMFQTACNDVQGEVDERYMLLPVDADGVPIHTGDTLVKPNGERARAWFFNGYSNDCLDEETCYFVANECRHAKPDAVRELLLDFYSETHGITAEERDELVDGYAERIREAVSGE